MSSLHDQHIVEIEEIGPSVIINEIECVIGKTDNSYVLDIDELKKTLSKVTYNVIKKRTSDNKEFLAIPSSGSLAFSELPIIKVYKSAHELVHYESKDNGQIIDIVEFQIAEKQRKKEYFDENTNTYKNLDCEYMYRKLREKWVGIQHTKEIEVATIKFSIYNILIINDSFITPMWKYTDAPLDSNLVKFDRFNFIESTLKNKLKELECDNFTPNDHELNAWQSSRYITLNVYNYTQFGERDQYKKELLRIENINNLEKILYKDAIKQKNEDLKIINDVIKLIIENIVKRSIKPVYNDIYVITKLNVIFNSVKGIESKTKTHTSYNESISKIQSLINKIKSASTNEEINTI